MRSIQIHTFVKHRVREAIRSMIVATFSTKTHTGGTYIYRDDEALGNEEIHVDVTSSGDYTGKYTGTYGEWRFTADVPNEVKVKPVDKKARDYHETKHTVSTN